MHGMHEASEHQNTVPPKDASVTYTCILSRFFPCLIIWPTWFLILATGDHFSAVFQWWPAGLAMMIGSFVAGSTPLGGGVIAFPVSVLFLRFTSGESRDISLLIQSVGMNAASYLLVRYKRNLLHKKLIFVFVAVGSVGAVFGTVGIVNVTGATINLAYTILVFEFGIFYFYRNKYLLPQDGIAAVKSSEVSLQQDSIVTVESHGKNFIVYFLMIVSSFLGGIATANVGTGADIALYMFGILGWNLLRPNQGIEDNQLTASSIVVMGTLSLVCVLSRLIVGGSFSPRTLETWAVMVPVVVLGAPLGSLILTPARLPWLRRLFYFLAVFQLAMFGALKIRREWTSWMIVSSLTVAQISALVGHRWCTQKKTNT